MLKAEEPPGAQQLGHYSPGLIKKGSGQELRHFETEVISSEGQLEDAAAGCRGAGRRGSRLAARQGLARRRAPCSVRSPGHRGRSSPISRQRAALRPAACTAGARPCVPEAAAWLPPPRAVPEAAPPALGGLRGSKRPAPTAARGSDICSPRPQRLCRSPPGAPGKQPKAELRREEPRSPRPKRGSASRASRPRSLPLGVSGGWRPGLGGGWGGSAQSAMADVNACLKEQTNPGGRLLRLRLKSWSP